MIIQQLKRLNLQRLKLQAVETSSGRKRKWWEAWVVEIAAVGIAAVEMAENDMSWHHRMQYLRNCFGSFFLVFWEKNN